MCPTKSMDPAEQKCTKFLFSSSLPSSNQGRKIVHSRLSAEYLIVADKREEALTNSPDDCRVELSPKPPLVRKKSSELVLPALQPPSARRRPSSMPRTLGYSKAVHFD